MSLLELAAQPLPDLGTYFNFEMWQENTTESTTESTTEFLSPSESLVTNVTEASFSNETSITFAFKNVTTGSTYQSRTLLSTSCDCPTETMWQKHMDMIVSGDL